MKIIITEEQKKKLFIPRRLSGENSKWVQWNKEQPVKDGIRINQYDEDGLKTGYWEYYYYNGGIMSKGSYINGKEEGLWEWYYYLNGNIKLKGLYVNGNREGIWEHYFTDGNIGYKELYKDGKFIKKLPLNESEQPKKKLFIPRRQSGENSKWNQWNKEQPVKDGVRINQYTDDGLKTGIWEEYYNGNIESKGSYKDGKEDGIWEEYYSNGNIRYKGIYKDGKEEGIWEWYHINGNLRSKELYKNGKLVKKLPLNESEQPKKKKLFIPRRQSGENSRWNQWNKEQPVKDGIRINQYTHDGIKTGIWEEYYSNGNIESKGSYKEGKREGLWEYYYPNGNIWYKGSYKDGKEEGIWEYYWDNGNIESRGPYKDGKRQGIWKFYNSNGNLYSKRLFKNGKLVKKLPLNESEQPKKKKLFIPRRLSGENSKWIQWNKEQPVKDGVRINQYTHDGIKTGYWEYYDENGNIESKGSYKDGVRSGLWEFYHINGNIWSRGSYVDGKREGLWGYYKENGNLYLKGLYKDGKLVKSLPLTESEQPKKKLFIPRRQSGENSKWNDWNKEQPVKDGVRINQYTHDGLKTGIWEEYYWFNGNIESKGSYKDGVREGIWEYYYSNGNIKSKGLFKDGLKDGIWEEYHDNGNIESRGSYKGGDKEGLWEEYWDNGDIHSKGSYKDGKEEGIWEFYGGDGNLHRKGPYKDGKRQGIWEVYYSNGNIMYRYSYKDGKKDGLLVYYSENGSIGTKRLYKDDKKVRY